MAKKQETYWFKHEGNFRRTQPALIMRSVYGAEGYGWYWMLIEMMREAENYQLSLTGKYSIQGIAKELEADQERVDEFIKDCINEFEIFDYDGQFFWSPSLKNKMTAYDDLCEKRKEAVNSRWNKE